MCNCFVVCVVREMMMKGREKVKPGAGTQPIPVGKHQGDGQVLTSVLVRRTNRYQQDSMLSQHTYYGRVWNLIRVIDVQSSDQKVYISTPPSPEVENFQIKIYYPRPAEPEADMLPSEPAWRAI